jgi:hypothetical protein
MRWPITLRSKRWQRQVWRWPVTSPPIAPPTYPPVFRRPDIPAGWSTAALHSCLDHLTTSTVTEARHVIVENSWTDGPAAFCVIYRVPYFDGLIGLRRDAADARAAIEAQDWNHNMMTNGYYMDDEVVLNGGTPDPVRFGWNVADFDIGEPHSADPSDPVDPDGVHWHGNLANGTPAGP